MKLYHGQEAMTALDDIGLTLTAYKTGQVGYDNAPIWTIKVTFEGRTQTFSSFATPLNNPHSSEYVDFGVIAFGIVNDYHRGQMDFNTFAINYGTRRSIWLRCREHRRNLIRLFGNHLKTFANRTERGAW
jgi:hypothetical protein